MILLFTFLETVIVVALLLIFGSTLFRRWFKSQFRNPGPRALGKYNRMSQPDSLPRIPPANNMIELVKINSDHLKQKPKADETSYRGAMSPAGMQIVPINFYPPGTAFPQDEYNNISVYRTKTDTIERTSRVLEISRKIGNGQLVVVYVVSATEVKNVTQTIAESVK